MYFIYRLLMCCVILVISVNGSLPEYIHVCHRNDPHINECIIKSNEVIRPKLREGISELNVPPIEPLFLGSIFLQRGPQGAHVNLNVTRLQAWGPSTFIIKSFNYNIKKNIFEFKALIPNLYFKGKYSVNMNIIFLKINGHGNIKGNFSNFLIDAKMYGRKINKASSNSQYLQFNKIDLKLHIGRSLMKMEGLFGGNPVLSQIASDVLDSNADAVVEEIRPALETSLSDVFTKIANGICESFTYDELFPL